MGVPAFWDFIKPAAKTRTLLNLATTEGFEPNKRGLRTLLVGIDIRQGPAISAIQINACIQIHSGNQAAALKTLFYQLCNLQEAPVTPIFVFDGPGRPVFKRGVAVSHNQPWLIGPLKDLLTAFRYYFYEAPGEAEAELADLNKLGFVDVVITEDSDAVIFGAPCVFRKPHVTDMSQIYTADSLASHPFYLDEDGLLLLVLLLGGDYHRGIFKCGPTIAHALARCGFGRDLRRIVTGLSGDKRDEELLKWRNALKDELKTNSAGLLEKRQPKLANNIPPDFPDLDVVELYTDPLTSWSSRFAGTPPDTSCWTPCEPIVNQISDFCVARFGWQEVILDRFKSNLWPGVALRMIFSVRSLFFSPLLKF
ncbi:PIN domain-like protein [Mycena sp. CBHHK59/15]|nr:PIN domain-like protein [Mycena sp. CBHHK59/15]